MAVVLVSRLTVARLKKSVIFGAFGFVFTDLLAFFDIGNCVIWVFVWSVGGGGSQTFFVAGR